MKPRKLILDGDMLVHRSCTAVEKDTRFQEKWHILFSKFSDAWNVLQDTLHDLGDTAGTEEFVMVFSDPEVNWRKLYDPTYKEDRKGTRKPLAYWDVREALEEQYESHMLPTLEGDDTMGILMTTDPGPYELVMWSGDKDLKQIPGLHIDDDEVVSVSEQDGDFFHMYQTLAGDVTDGYSGCPGVGGKIAEKCLKDGIAFEPYKHVLKSGKRKGEEELRWAERPAENMWDTVKTLYERAGSDEDHAIHQARLARILRAEDYVNNEVKLWLPKS